MALASSSRLGWALLLICHAYLLLVLPVTPALGRLDRDRDEEEENLLDGLNRFRETLDQDDLDENDNADCLADRIVEEFQGLPCVPVFRDGSITALPGDGSRISDYYRLISDCEIDLMHTKDGIILPACIPDLDPYYVLTNYTQSGYAEYLRDAKYTSAGIGSEGNWVVVVLATDTDEGSFDGAIKIEIGKVIVGWLVVMGLTWLLV